MIVSDWLNSEPLRTHPAVLRLSALGICLATVILFWPSVSQAIVLSFQDDRYIQIVAAPLICLYLLYWDRANIFSRIAYSPRSGTALISFGFVLALLLTSRLLVADQSTRLIPAIAVLILICQAGFILSFGMSSFRKAIYPLSLLWLAVPVPPALIDRLTVAYQHGSASASFAILNLAGMSVLRDGTSFSIPGLDFNIAPECSGIRSGIAFLLVGTLASRLYLRSWWGRLLLILATVPITIFKNAIRIVVTTSLGAFVDRAFIDGPFHHQYGGFVFAPVDFLLFVPLLLALRKLDMSRAGDTRPAPVPVPARP